MSIYLDVVSGPEGHCICIGDKDGGHRLAGPKPRGGGSVAHRFEIKPQELMRELKALMEEQGIEP